MRQQAVTVTQSGRVDGQATGEKDAKRGETAQKKLHREEVEKNRDESAASLKKKKKSPTLKWDSMQEGQEKKV